MPSERPRISLLEILETKVLENSRPRAFLKLQFGTFLFDRSELTSKTRRFFELFLIGFRDRRLRIARIRSASVRICAFEICRLSDPFSRRLSHAIIAKSFAFASSPR